MATGDFSETPPDSGSGGKARWFGLPSRKDLPPEVRQEMELARQDPGPSWREWFLFSAAKWWLGLAFLIVDVWVVVSAFTYGALTLLLLVVAVYLEIVLWQYLWHRPESVSHGRNAENRLWWLRPVPVGRWTPEAEEVRGHAPVSGATETAPDPKEFL